MVLAHTDRSAQHTDANVPLIDIASKIAGLVRSRQQKILVRKADPLPIVAKHMDMTPAPQSAAREGRRKIPRIEQRRSVIVGHVYNDTLTIPRRVTPIASRILRPQDEHDLVRR